ncbi:MAG: hypothetical protein R2713_16050 [Ilumatobacteraceae bacterium]|nr:hypothetical protein [Acidimicrobiales bacterium]MCB9395252.1 hypothetical protein [Acidimicrobiaceae bacterium]
MGVLTAATSSTDDDGWPDRADIHDPAAIALLTDLRGVTFLSPFLASTHTLTSAARTVERPVSSMAHWVPRFVDTGLVERVGEIRRAGAPMPRYRAVARKLVVPFEMIPFDARVRMLDTGRLHLLRRFMDGMDEAVASSRSFGLSFAAYGERGSVIDLEETDAERALRSYTDGWMMLELTEEDALACSRELESLVERYRGRQGPRTYIFHGGIAPDPTFRWRSANDR